MDRLGAAGLTGVGTRRAVQHADPRTAGGCIEQPLRSAVKPRCQRRPRPRQQDSKVSTLCQHPVIGPKSNRSCSGHVRVNPASLTAHGSHRSPENTRLGHPNRHSQPDFQAHFRPDNRIDRTRRTNPPYSESHDPATQPRLRPRPDSAASRGGDRDRTQCLTREAG